MFHRRKTATDDTSDAASGRSDERRSESAESAASPSNGPVTPGKGRPTPKRRDAERARRRVMKAPKDRKDAYRQMRARQKAQRRRAWEGIRAGDERYLPPRDRGPARALARDYVDSRRTIGEFFLWLFPVIIGMALVPIPAVQQAYFFGWSLLIAAIVFDSVRIGRRVRELAAERCPEESTQGLRMYAIMRAMQLRRLRLPPPRVNRGDPI